MRVRAGATTTTAMTFALTVLGVWLAVALSVGLALAGSLRRAGLAASDEPVRRGPACRAADPGVRRRLAVGPRPREGGRVPASHRAFRSVSPTDGQLNRPASWTCGAAAAVDRAGVFTPLG